MHESGHNVVFILGGEPHPLIKEKLSELKAKYYVEEIPRNIFGAISMLYRLVRIIKRSGYILQPPGIPDEAQLTLRIITPLPSPAAHSLITSAIWLLQCHCTSAQWGLSWAAQHNPRNAGWGGSVTLKPIQLSYWGLPV